MMHATRNHIILCWENSAATLEESLEVSYKTKYNLTIGFTNHTLWYLPKLTAKIISTQNLPHGSL